MKPLVRIPMQPAPGMNPFLVEVAFELKGWGNEFRQVSSWVGSAEVAHAVGRAIAEDGFLYEVLPTDVGTTAGVYVIPASKIIWVRLADA